MRNWEREYGPGLLSVCSQDFCDLFREVNLALVFKMLKVCCFQIAICLLSTVKRILKEGWVNVLCGLRATYKMLSMQKHQYFYHALARLFI